MIFDVRFLCGYFIFFEVINLYALLINTLGYLVFWSEGANLLAFDRVFGVGGVGLWVGFLREIWVFVGDFKF